MLEACSMVTNLYVGNLSYRATDQDLAELFGQFGHAVSARVIMDRETNRSRGFGFVEMSTEEEAKAAVEKLDQTDFQGRSLRVNLAHPRADRAPRGDRPRYPGGGSRERDEAREAY
jgi:RNA recognition motif-containing protein